MCSGASFWQKLMGQERYDASWVSFRIESMKVEIWRDPDRDTGEKELG
jgi:hypothetical protein